MKTESAKRKILKLLHLAADARGNAPQARAATALAKRLMRAHGWSQDDLRDGALPTDATERIILPCQNGEEHRFLAVTKIVMTRFKSVTSEARRSIVSANAIIDLRGTKEELKPAVQMWHWLNDLLAMHWRERREVRSIGQRIHQSITRMLPNANVVTYSVPDPISWCKGVADGYWSAEHQNECWQNTIEAHKIKQLAKPWKPKRRNLPKRNPFALACIPKPKRKSQVVIVPTDVSPSQWAKEHLIPTRGAKAKVVYQDEIDSPEPEPEPKETHILDDYSFRSGWKLGCGLYQKINDYA